VNVFLCSINYHYIKAYGGMEIYLDAFLTSVLDVGEWSASRPGCFILGKVWIGSCVDPRAHLDAVAKRKYPVPAGDRTHRNGSFTCVHAENILGSAFRRDVN
jgi:hypothetical protein